MTTKKRKKNAFKYCCERCDYYSNNKTDYNRHLQTRKHNTTNTTKIQQKNAFFCECGKNYSYRASLYNHKKKCLFNKNEIISCTTQSKSMEQMFLELMEKNQELQEQILELSKEPKTIIKNQNQTNNFNLNNFLNIQCKDAMNLSEFIEQVKITFDDLLYLSNHGFVKSFQNTFVKELGNMEQTKRPIHCTDKKRKAIMVKDNNIWKKDDKHELICGAVKQINDKQITAFSKHCKDRDPNYMDSDRNQITNSKMIINMCSYNEENKDKMHKNLINQITSKTQIDK
jgi:hypothetical protein